MAQTEVNYSPVVIEQVDLKSTYAAATIASGEGVVEVGTPMKGVGDPEKWEKVTDDSQHIRLGVAIESADATSGEVPGNILTGGGIALSSLTLDAITITGMSVTQGSIGLLKNNGIRVVDTCEAIKKCGE